MITQKAKDLAVDLQAALGGKDGLAINNSIIALAEELGGSRVVVVQLVTPISQMVYLMSLLIQHMPSMSIGKPAPHTALLGDGIPKV